MFITTPLTSAFAYVNFGLILSHILQAIGDAILDFFRRFCLIKGCYEKMWRDLRDCPESSGTSCIFN